MSERTEVARRNAQSSRYVNHPSAAFTTMYALAYDVERLSDDLEAMEADFARYREYTKALAATLVAERMDRWGSPTPSDGAYPLGGLG